MTTDFMLGNAVKWLCLPDIINVLPSSNEPVDQVTIKLTLQVSNQLQNWKSPAIMPMDQAAFNCTQVQC